MGYIIRVGCTLLCFVRQSCHILPPRSAFCFVALRITTHSARGSLLRIKIMVWSIGPNQPAGALTDQTAHISHQGATGPMCQNQPIGGAPSPICPNQPSGGAPRPICPNQPPGGAPRPICPNQPPGGTPRPICPNQNTWQQKEGIETGLNDDLRFAADRVY